MDPTNSTIPNSNTVPSPAPSPVDSTSVASSAPVAEPEQPVTPVTPTAPVSSVAPATPASPASSVGQTMQPPVSPVAQPPVSPVVQPPVNPVINPNPVNPVFQPGSGSGGVATDPITIPEPASKPDLAEEELNAPMQAVGPVPGSIGSAVSGPENTETTSVGEGVFQEQVGSPQSVSFTDPATQPEVNTAAVSAKPTPKKTSKTTWIALIIVAMMVVIALVVVLLMQMGILQF